MTLLAFFYLLINPVQPPCPVIPGVSTICSTTIYPPKIIPNPVSGPFAVRAPLR